MVRFSCFHTHIHCHKSKKTVQDPYKAMHKTFQDSTKDPALDVSSTPISLDPFLLKAHGDNPSNTSAEKVTSSSSVENCWKSEEMSSNFSPEGNVEVHQTICLKKSQSLGSGLDLEGIVSSGIDIEDEVDKGFSCGDSQEKDCSGIFDSKNPEMILPNQYPEVLVLESFQENSSDRGNPETNFSNRDLVQLQEEGHEKYATQSYGEHANGSDHHSPGTSPMITKSCSWPNVGASEPTSEEYSPFHVLIGPQHASSEDDSPFHVLIGPRHASCEDLAVLDGDEKEFLNHDFEFHGLADEDRDNMIFESDKDKCENSSGDGHDSFNLAGLTKEWTINETYGIGAVKNLQGESSAHRWDELPNKEFKIKRIEEWVSSIDLQDNTPSEEISESSYPTEVKRVSNSLGGVTIAKFNAKTTPGTEAANNYISSLTATSTSAQLINLGLVSIPFLSAFVNLRALNLSGNAIVKITAGALPRGLHMLNLSKNNISSIEGLRELTRLRVLDLSFNRIFRIGHGLASCPSLKELYLAGNKISEIEGLHRLLKLNILDLRFNKISTAKCLGQLAANYASLQAISLEGNPAQRNVGDEQLKKYLQGILPYLVSFNKQPIKATSSSKEVSDRTTRSAATVHQFDRGPRSENKVARKGSHSLVPQKVSSSSHGSTSRAVNSPKQSKGQHVHLPPSGTKETNHHHHPLDLRGKLLGWSNLSMRRSQSEGTLGTS